MPAATPFHRSLRFKLLLASLTLLVIPWIGYRYLLEVEENQRHSQETLLLSRAEVVANLLAAAGGRDELPSDEMPLGRRSLYVHPLSQKILVDGYAEDWGDLLDQARRYSASETVAGAVAFDLLCGFWKENLYLLIRVSDTTPIYPRADRTISDGDHLLLALAGNERQAVRQYLLGTPAPGWLSIRRRKTGEVENTFRGEWQESPGGYTVELRLPLEQARHGLTLAVIDLGETGGTPVGIASTSGWRRNDELARLVMPSLPSAKLLQGLDSRSHRYTILNRERQVIGRHGTLSGKVFGDTSLLHRILALLLGLQPAPDELEREHAGRMDGPEIRRALGGEGSIYRYQSRGVKRMTLSAAYPIRREGEVNGVILVEQTTGELLLLQQRALEQLLIASLLLFLITGGSLLLLATYLTRRISLLNRKFNRTVSADGRVVQPIGGTVETDELGALEQGFSTVLQRLQAYNSYLEGLASRLAHEFRTPLTIVQSSLENLSADAAPESRRYAERALEGTRRLNLILNRLREATHLEQSLQSASLSEIDLRALCASLSEAYGGSYPELRFESRLPSHPLRCPAAPELISQALDKLVSNAVDFHRPGTPIRIELQGIAGTTLRLSVSNQGPPLPEGMRDSLFESMVSLRKKRDSEPHLGMGLYLVRLIAEFHRGKAFAENIEGGVRVSVELPSL